MRTIGRDEYPWPGTLFDLSPDDLKEFNTVSFKVSSFEVFKGDVLNSFNEARDKSDFVSNLTRQSKYRQEAAVNAIKEIVIRTAYNPKITTAVSAMLQTFYNSNSLDCLVKLLDALLPEEEQQRRLDPIPAKASPNPNPSISSTEMGQRKRKREEQLRPQRPSTKSRQVGDATQDGTMASQSNPENVNIRRSERLLHRQRLDQALPVPEIPSNKTRSSRRRKKQRT